nr:hypothetical protein [uncultured Desulfobacter sp.]
MYNKFKKPMFCLSSTLLLFLVSCTTIPVQPPANNFSAYTVKEDQTILNRYAPVFVVENYEMKYNRIGTPSAEINEDGKEKIYVDSDKATIYAEARHFKTIKNTYTNLIYRIHFEKIPGGLIPFHLGKGKNIGLIVIITLNSRDEPILYTSVHTCGCYLAFVPTSYMPSDVFPDSWKNERQSVYSENLPGILKFNKPFSEQTKTMILIRSETHRVKDMWLSDFCPLEKYNIVEADIKPLGSLEKLPLDDHETTSFYETSGSRKGYVKGSSKIRERLLISWWAFDWRVGEDKKFGKDKTDGIVFYTSLKPWNRERSDMRNFDTFLKFWKWKL